MSPFRPDLVDVWIFRLLAGGPDGVAAPSGAGPSGATPAVDPAAVAPSVVATSGLAPAGVGPSGAAPSGVGPSGAAMSVAATSGAAPAGEIEILLLRRSAGRILPGLWQCVSGSLEVGETVTAGALRELVEETGFGRASIEAFFDLDQVNQFHEPSVGAIVTSAIFAVRVRAGSEPRLSVEHDAMRWVSPTQALELAIWPAYRESIRRIVENLRDPERAIWFELTLQGDRARR